MRLFLCSSRLTTVAPELVALAGRSARVAITANALDNLPDFPRGAWMEEERGSLARVGFRCSELDLREYYGKPEALRAALADVNLVWATGGNSFVLRDALRRSRLDALLLERLEDDSVAYGGYSAGACICGPSLRGIELVDDMRSVSEPLWDGLGLLESSLVPHYGSDHAESEDVERVVDYFRAHEMPFRVLRDGQALVVRDRSSWVIEM
jgi:dipeptidase E